VGTPLGLWLAVVGLSWVPKKPEFVVQQVPVADPFGVYFSLKNSSKAFPTTLGGAMCHVIFVGTADGNVYGSNYIDVPAAYPIMIEPDTELPLACPFNRIRLSRAQVRAAQARIFISYSDFISNPQCIESPIFTYNEQTHSWVMGQPLNEPPHPIGGTMVSPCDALQAIYLRPSSK
jgi:hypothetical protein